MKKSKNKKETFAEKIRPKNIIKRRAKKESHCHAKRYIKIRKMAKRLDKHEHLDAL